MARRTAGQAGRTGQAGQAGQAGAASGWSAALIAGLLLVLAAGPALAQPPSVPVPRHDAPTLALSVTGASTEAVLVTSDDQFGSGLQTMFSGPTGSAGAAPVELTALEALDLTDRDPAYVYTSGLGVVGDTYAWVGEIGRTSSTPARHVLHRTNLLTGADAEVEVPLRPVAFTGDSWLAWSGTDLIRTTFAGERTTVGSGLTNALRLVADASGVLVSSLSPSTGMQLRAYRLDLITFGTGSAPATIERVADSLEFIGSTGLSGTTIAWLGRDQQVAHPVSIHQRARTGGVVSSYSETSIHHGDELPLAVGSGRVGYVVPDPAGTFLRVLTGSTATAGTATATATRTELPAGGTGVAAVGDRFLTATGGPIATAGVYSVDGRTPSRVGIVPTPQIGVVSLAFSASRLFTADESSDAGPGLAIWAREVTGGSVNADGTGTPPELGDENLFGHRAARLRDVPGRSISFSAGRGALRNPDPDAYQWRFFDRGVLTGSATQPRPDESDSNGLVNDIQPNTSGPYTLVRGKVYRPDGSLAFTRPGEGSSQTARDDLYGNRLIYSLADAGRNTNTGWVHDLAQPRSSTNPRRLFVQSCTGSCPARVSVWGNLTAWVTGSTRITVVNTGTGRSRSFVTSGPVQELELGEGMLAWQAPGYTTWVLDLLTKNSQPVRLAGKATTIAVDDHWLARRVADTRRVVVYRLPFGHPYHPRLIGTLAPTAFSPNGDGRADTWTPQFDTTKPLTGVVLRIKGGKSGRTFRTLTGTGPDGSIRGLTWNGLSGAGTVLAAGTYRWELSAEAADGDGALIPAYSGTTLTGTVRLSRFP